MTAEQMKYEFDVGYDKITNFDAPGYEPKEISTFLTKAQEELIYELLVDNAYNERVKKGLSRLKDMITLSTFTTGKYSNGYISDVKISISGTTLAFVTGSTPDTITDSGNGFLTAGFRAGDIITITGATTSANNGTYTIGSVAAGVITLVSGQSFDTAEAFLAGTTITADPVLKVVNESADLTVGATSIYYNKIVTIEDVEVDPIDDDFYHANKSNPFKKPDEKTVWRLDYSSHTNKTHEYITTADLTIANVKCFIYRRPRPIIVQDANYVTADGSINGVPLEGFTAAGQDCYLDELVHREIVDRAVKLAYAALQDEKGFQLSSIQQQETERKQ
jgi:hypothetical protein